MLGPPPRGSLGRSPHPQPFLLGLPIPSLACARLSPQLAAWVGKETASRPEITKHFWAYCKERGLQVCAAAEVAGCRGGGGGLDGAVEGPHSSLPWSLRERVEHHQRGAGSALSSSCQPRQPLCRTRPTRASFWLMTPSRHWRAKSGSRASLSPNTSRTTYAATQTDGPSPPALGPALPAPTWRMCVLQ